MPSEKQVVNEEIEKEQPNRLFLVGYFIGKPSRKYGTVWRDKSYTIPVMARNAEHARRLATTSVRKNLDSFHSKLKVQVRWVEAYSI